MPPLVQTKYNKGISKTIRPRMKYRQGVRQQGASYNRDAQHITKCGYKYRICRDRTSCLMTNVFDRLHLSQAWSISYFISLCPHLAFFRYLSHEQIC